MGQVAHVNYASLIFTNWHVLNWIKRSTMEQVVCTTEVTHIRLMQLTCEISPQIVISNHNHHQKGKGPGSY